MSAREDVLTELACDYVTATVKNDKLDHRLHSYATGLFRHQAEIGNKVKPFSGSGFKGWQCGSVQISTRNEECMVRLSSDSAALSWSKVVEFADNVSRFDLQATVLIDGSVTKRIDRYLKCASRHAIANNMKPVVRWVRELRGGYTLYLGARESLVFGRIYDKWEREKLECYRGCFRAEVQFQNKLAKVVAQSLVQAHSPRLRIASHVEQFFAGRAVKLELPYKDEATYCCSRKRTDVTKTLEWLQVAVRPSVVRLIALGQGEEVFRALGLIDDKLDASDQVVQASEYDN